MKRKSSMEDLYHRYKGVLLLVSIPVVLIVIVLAVMPRSGPESVNVLSEVLPGKAAKGKGGTQELKYAIVIDAGSTGSRVHIYKFEVGAGGLDLGSDTFEQLKPGLSQWADQPDKAAESLQPLLNTALSTVPEELHASTPLKVGATAGLRLLPGDKSQQILKAVEEYLKKQPFKLTGVSIIDGTEEGGFAWLTLNYLLGHLGQPEEKTVAAIDLGGGSVQEAFALTADEAKEAPKGYVSTLSGSGKTYNVYVHSYLGYGLMAGRKAVLSWDETKAANPCVPKDHKGSYEYGGTTMEMKSAGDGSSFDSCSKLVHTVLKADSDCGVIKKDQCSFNGAWGGAKVPSVFYITSYFWDRASDAGLIKDKDAIAFVLNPVDLKTAGDKACKTPITELAKEFPAVEENQRSFLCMDLSFCHTLLTKGFKVKEDAKITIVKRIKYKAEQVEAAWPLGAAIDLLS